MQQFDLSLLLPHDGTLRFLFDGLLHELLGAIVLHGVEEFRVEEFKVLELLAAVPVVKCALREGLWLHRVVCASLSSSQILLCPRGQLHSL